MIIKPYEIPTEDQFRKILRSKATSENGCPGWLSAVRRLSCFRITCNVILAGTAHHVFGGGMAMRCDDRLTIPLCIDCHVSGPDPVQNMNSEQFKIAIGMTEEEACWRVYRLITDKYYNGELV